MKAALATAIQLVFSIILLLYNTVCSQDNRIITLECLSLKSDSIVKVTAFLDTYELSKLKTMSKHKFNTMETSKAYIGMWVTKDGHIRHELLPNNRYDEARGNQQSAYQGDFKVTGNHIDYADDTGFTADGEFRDGILYHAGMVLYKEN